MVAAPPVATAELFAPFADAVPPEFWARAEALGGAVVGAWEKAALAALTSGDAAPLHATRDGYLAGLTDAATLLDTALTLADRATDAGRTDRLRASREELRRHHDALFPRWQSLDDLEGLLLERITPSRERRLALVEQCPPPQAWYDDDANPFEPEE